MAGTIEKRGKNSWRLTVTAGYNGSGEQIRYRKTVKTESMPAAEKQLALFVAEVERGQVATQKKVVLREFFTYWMEHHAAGHHEAKTILRNRELFKRINSAIGNIRVDKLEPRHLLELYKNLAESGISKARQKKGADGKVLPPPVLSGNTIQKHHKLLSALMTKAVQWGFAHSNPCTRVEPPKYAKKQIPILDEEQTTNFLRLLGGEETKYRLLALLALSTGLRRGELFGLEWSHVDLSKNALSVQQASQYIPGEGLKAKCPKTEESKRVVAVPEAVTELLRQHKAEQNKSRLKQGAIWQSSDRIFTTWDGRPMHPDSFNNWLRKFIADNNLPHISPHSFRHMSATFALAQGINLKSVSARLGHARTSTTADIYSHALKSVDREIADKMNTFITAANIASEAKEGQAN